MANLCDCMGAPQPTLTLIILSSTQGLNLKLSIVMSEDYFCLTIDYGESFMILSI